MVTKKIMVSLLLVFLSLATLGAAPNPVVDLQLLASLGYAPATEKISVGMLPNLNLSFKSENKGNVRGEVVLSTASLSSSSTIDDVLQKAYFKAKLPAFRLTAGKTRLSWGDGILFNAGDVIYGSSSTSVSLTQAELRSETSYLAAINYPLGLFSFAEALVLPAKTMSAKDLGFGFRLYTTVGQTKVEGGFLSKADPTRLHTPYVSLQGNIGPDWYLSSSVGFNEQGSIEKETWMISGGLYHLMTLSGDRNLGLRLEFLSRPFGNWSWESQNDSNCALLLYPEVTYSPSNSLTYRFQSIISPLDGSLNVTGGVSWSVFEGFSLSAYLSSGFGDTTDLFNWDGSPSSAANLLFAASWIY